MKQILIINGHPNKESFNYALSAAYKEGAAKNNVQIDQINIGDLDFNPNLKFGYRQRTDLEPDLLDAIEKIKKSDHIVWLFPMWWYSYPAIMKGFIDRAFLPGITYQPIEGKPLPKKLLKGKTARVIITSDTPRWYDFLYMKSPTRHQIKKGVLQFCGVKPVKITQIATIKGSNKAFRDKWLQKVYQLGEKLK
jgi:putative NADPH-quinone reductase